MQNLELEAQLARASDDAGLCAVYADWMTERGDPRGELISIELALEADPHSSSLHIRRAQLHEQHDAGWVGPLLVSNRVRLEWRRGWIDKVALGDTRSRRLDPAPRHDKLYAALRELPAAALVRKVSFGHVDGDSQPSWDHCVAAVARHGAPASLRELALVGGHFWATEDTSVGDLSPAYPSLANLAVLRLELGAFELGHLGLPALRELDLAAWPITAGNIASIARGDVPALETLHLRLFYPRRGAACDAGDLAALLAAAPPRLRHLGIENASFADELVPLLVPLAPQLATLRLGYGKLGDRGAQLILEHAGAFEHLDALDIVESEVSADAIESLAAAIPGLRAERRV